MIRALDRLAAVEAHDLAVQVETLRKVLLVTLCDVSAQTRQVDYAELAEVSARLLMHVAKYNAFTVARLEFE